MIKPPDQDRIQRQRTEPTSLQRPVPGARDIGSHRDIFDDEPPARWKVLRRILIGLAAALVVAGIAFGPSLLASLGKKATTPALATVARRSFPVVAAASGSLLPSAQLGLNFPMNGQLRELDVAPGDHVKPGQVLAKIDDSSQQANLQAAQSSLGAAQQAASVAQAPDAARVQALQGAVLSAQTLVTDAIAIYNTDAQTPINSSNGRLQQDQSRIDAARSQLGAAQGNLASAQSPNAGQLASAQAQVAAAQGQVQRAQAELARTVLIAPTDATVLAVNAQVGESVSSGATASSSLPGSTGTTAGANGAPAASHAVIVIGNGTAFSVSAAFSEADASRLQVAMLGSITFDALPGLTIPCHVVAIAQSATNVNGVSQFYATIAPDKAEPRLRSGMSANVSVSVAHATNVLAVPNQALYLLDQRLHVDVWYRGHTVPTEVKTGLTGDTLTEITSGLTDGQQVVLSARHALSSPGTAGNPSPTP